MHGCLSAMARPWLYSFLLWGSICALLFQSVSSCDDHPSHDALISLISTHVPADVKECLGWRTPVDILSALMQPRYLQWMELFCGTGTLSNALFQELPRGRSVDVVVGDQDHNILTPAGFGMILLWCLALVPYGLAWFAPPCSLWVFLSAGVHKRSMLRPSGDTSRLDVRQCNMIVDRCCLLMRILTLRAVQWICEQPVTSLLFHYASFMRLRTLKLRISHAPLERRFLWLGAWGGDIPKPTALWGISPLLRMLHSKRPARAKPSVKTTTKKIIIKNGKPREVYRIYGVRQTLKSSQCYPQLVCKEVAHKFKMIYSRSLLEIFK